MPACERGRECRCLTNQVAVITGASRGLGATFARVLASYGMHVALFARSETLLRALAAEIVETGGNALVVPGDTTDPRAVTALIEQTERSLGPIDFFVANAGVLGPVGPLWECDLERWWQSMETNFKGPLLACHQVLPRMISRGRGRMVLVSSHAGHFRWPTVSSYSVSKNAVNKLVENLGRELKSTGVSVFAWHPGFTTTGLTHETLNLEGSPESATGRLRLWTESNLRGNKALTPEQSAEALFRIAHGRVDHRSGEYLTVDDVFAYNPQEASG